MKTYLKEIVDMHQIALNLTYTESSILYNTLLEFTSDSQEYDELVDDTYISEEVYIEYYASIMFKFMTILINLK